MYRSSRRYFLNVMVRLIVKPLYNGSPINQLVLVSSDDVLNCNLQFYTLGCHPAVFVLTLLKHN